MNDITSSRPLYVPQGSLDNATLTQRVYQSLREDILSNRLAPGSPLQETAVAAALGVSRGPVREAIRQLDAEGLVSLVPRRGTVVSSLSREELIDSYQVREVLEILATRLATPRLSPKDLEELEQLNDEMRQYAAQGETDQFFTANEAFHALFVKCSGNNKLQESYYPLVNQMRRYRMSSVSLRGGFQRSCDDHEEILRAVKEGNAEEAARLLSEHIQAPQRILESNDEVELTSRPYTPDERNSLAEILEQEEPKP